MKLDEVYEHFDRKWCRIAISLGMTESSVAYWRKRGGIPYRSQLLIESVTKGKLKAKQEHSPPKKGKS